MAVVQIPNLPPVITLNGSELFEVVQGGVSCKASTQQIANLYVINDIPDNAVTKYQYFAGLAAYPGIDPNLLYQSLAPDFSNAATIQFYTAFFVSINSPLWNLTISTYPGINMTTLYGLALAQPVWG